MTTPSDFNLPSKFSSFRDGQLDAALSLATSDKRFTLFDAPTGSGKSLTYMAASRILDARTLVLVGTRGLQRQLMSDFSSVGAVDMMGQSNYECVALGEHLINYGRPGAGCNEGPCHVGIYCNLKDDGGCLYYDAQDRARHADIVISNYAYWLTLGRHSDPNVIGEFDLIVMDEAHTAPSWLSSFCSVSLNKDEVFDLLGMDLPPLNEGIEVWASWAREARLVAKDQFAQERQYLEVSSQASTKRMLRLREITRDLEGIAMAHGWRQSETPEKDARMPGLHTDWIGSKTKWGVKFSPVWAHSYAESYLFRGSPRIVLCSATLPPTMCQYLGIPKSDSEHLSPGSGFDPKRRPFTAINCVKVDRNISEGDIRLWINKMDRIIGERLDRKGIIHTRSYARSKEILARSRHSDIMISHSGSRDLRSAIEQFKGSAAPKVLVSPSIEEGFDFPDDQARYQIIAKVPFLDTRDKLTKARSESDKNYLNHETALTIIQMAGRIVRSAADWGETFIVDDHWSWFKHAAKNEFPEWFRRAWRGPTHNLPKPMPLNN